ncbi:metallophosphoesterase family protein [Chitinophaga deserti]|uniref:metallophosphoesterase family protein n=1 Tax=Chitinophaga deserti TaxID=2164099 RepID=UPI000D6AD8EA|nr:metallophosphoesterase [Chitinophaga deserti]
MQLPSLSPETFAQKLSDPTVALKFAYLNDLLLNSEYCLIEFMVRKGAWKWPIPPKPPGYDTGNKTIELGVILFLLNNTGYIADNDIRQYAQYLKGALGLPNSQLPVQAYAWIMNNVLIYDDGGVISGGKYDTYDQGWFAAFLNLIITDMHDAWYGFPQGSPAPIKLDFSVSNYTITLGMIGDWGTGDTTAKAVLRQLTTLNPNYLIHLGDTYYSGSPATGQWAGYYFHPGEEMENLVNMWPGTSTPRSFTLNSNHEMYTGGNGYFGEALKTTGPFSLQKGMSYFALQAGDWTVLGLDSGYYGSSFDAFMDGSIGGEFLDREQINWIAGLNLNPAKTIVLTHHTGFQYDASAFMKLWDQVNGALGADPYAWYWGHVHNGIVYASPLTLPGTDGNLQSTSTYARCLGHAALPYGEASALINNPSVEWMETDKQANGLMLNGFATLTFQLDGQLMVTGIRESFYHLGTSSPVFSKRIF